MGSNNNNYLNDNLLGEDGDEASPLLPAIDEPPRVALPLPLKAPSALDIGRNRLVIAIDYGTTFTGKFYCLMELKVN